MPVRVEVYKNIHATKAAGQPVYSVRLKSTGVVVQHCTRVELSDPHFVVSEAGRQRVLAEGRKNVHAWVEGTLKWCVPIKDTPFETTEDGHAIVDGRVIPAERPYPDYRERTDDVQSVRYNPTRGASFTTQVWGEMSSVKRPLTRDGRYLDSHVSTDEDSLEYCEKHLPWVVLSADGIYAEASLTQTPWRRYRDGSEVV